MCAGSLTAGTSSSSQSPPEGEFETDKLAAAVGEDGWAIREACPLLLAAVSGRASDPASVRGDSAADLGATPADRIGRGGGEEKRLNGRRVGRRGARENRVR